MINAFILCDLFEIFLKIMQQTEKEALRVVGSILAMNIESTWFKDTYLQKHAWYRLINDLDL